jgi:hypothetical protein
MMYDVTFTILMVLLAATLTLNLVGWWEQLIVILPVSLVSGVIAFRFLMGWPLMVPLSKSVIDAVNWIALIWLVAALALKWGRILLRARRANFHPDGADA